MKELKVLHVTNAYPSENSPIRGIFVKEQIDALASFDDITVDRYILDVPKRGVVSYWDAFLYLRRLQKEYNIIHCHHILTGFIGFISVPKSKLLISFMSDGKNNLKGKLSFFGGFLFWLLTKYVRWGIYKSSVPSFGNFSEKELIPNGVNIKSFPVMSRADAKARIGLSANKIYLLFVSANSIRKEKRYDIFMSVVEELKCRGLPVEPLLMCNVPRSSVVYYFNAASCHLLVSDFEGSPNSVKESLVCGTPVVSRDVGGVKNILSATYSKYVLNTLDVKLVADVVVEAISEFETMEKRLELRNHMKHSEYTSEFAALRVKDYYRRIADAQI